MPLPTAACELWRPETARTFARTPTTEDASLSLPKPPDIVWLEDGSHDFGPRGQSGATLKGNIATAAAAIAGFARRLAAKMEGTVA